MPFGKIAAINTDKGFGFITPDGEREDLFFHCSTFTGDFDALTKGKYVKFVRD